MLFLLINTLDLLLFLEFTLLVVEPVLLFAFFVYMPYFLAKNCGFCKVRVHQDQDIFPFPDPSEY